MNYDNIMAKVVQQTNSVPVAGVNAAPQTDNNQLMNTIALEIKRQGG